MKINLYSVQSSKEKWFDQACSLYDKKLQAFCRFESVMLKSKAMARKNSAEKIASDSEQILKRLKPNDYVVLCDERGKTFNSQQFSKQLISWLEVGGSEVNFIIGGAFGASEELQKRANAKICLAPWVMNHHVAHVVLLEQIYRGFSIWKGLPYHNE